jgi:branched-chain amino acid transport system permease protein
MGEFLQVVVDGIANGAIYGTLALALVLIFRSTGIVNFAQGEMATFSTLFAWWLTTKGVGLWLAILAALALSFLGGMAVERVFIRPVEGGRVLNLVIITLGLSLAVNAAGGWLFGYTNRGFPSIFPKGVLTLGGVGFSAESFGIVGVLIAVAGLLWLIFQKTKLGLGMRAAAQNPTSSRLVGIRVGQMLMLGWGLAAVLGALAGVLVAPRLFLDPNMMASVLIYSFAGAALGGFDSPPGAVIGSLLIGVLENLAGRYVSFIGPELKVLVPLVIIFAVLLVRPAGLFGSPEVSRA